MEDLENWFISLLCFSTQMIIWPTDTWVQMGVIKFVTLCNNRNFALKKCFQLIKILSFKMIQLFRNETNGVSTVYSQPV